MDNFTKKKLKKPEEIAKGVAKGDFTITKREFDLEKSKKTFKYVADTASTLRGKTGELKTAHNKVFHKTKNK